MWRQLPCIGFRNSTVRKYLLCNSFRSSRKRKDRWHVWMHLSIPRKWFWRLHTEMWTAISSRQWNYRGRERKWGRVFAFYSKCFQCLQLLIMYISNFCNFFQKVCLGKERKKPKMKMRQCFGTNLNSLTCWVPTYVLFFLYNAFFLVSRDLLNRKFYVC